MGTPKNRVLRSNSNGSAINLSDIKELIKASNIELMTTLKHETGKIYASLTSLISRVDELEGRISRIESNQQTQESCLEVLKSCSMKNAVPLQEEIGGLLEEVCKEATLRAIKRNYLMLSGLPELSSGSIRERSEADIAKIQEVANAIGVDDLLPEEVSRIGKINANKPRLLRFKCRNSGQRSDLLRKSKLLRKTPHFSSVFVFPDRTLKQRQAEKLRRHKLFEESNDCAGEFVKNVAGNENFHGGF